MAEPDDIQPPPIADAPKPQKETTEKQREKYTRAAAKAQNAAAEEAEAGTGAGTVDEHLAQVREAEEEQRAAGEMTLAEAARRHAVALPVAE